MATEATANARSVTEHVQAQARTWLANHERLLQDQAYAVAQKAKQEILQHRAETQAQAQDHVQHLHDAAKSSFDALKERERTLIAHAEANFRVQEQETKACVRRWLQPGKIMQQWRNSTLHLWRGSHGPRALPVPNQSARPRGGPTCPGKWSIQASRFGGHGSH